MTTKSLALAASMLALVAMSGQAFAATPAAQQRLAIHEAQHFNAEVMQPQNAFDAPMSSQAIDHAEHRYEGGPKSDIY